MRNVAGILLFGILLFQNVSQFPCDYFKPFFCRRRYRRDPYLYVLFGLTVVILGGAVRAAAARMDSSAPVQISILDSLLSFGFSSMCKLIYFVYLIQFVLCEVNL